MEQILNFFPDKTISTLGWTIFHSIWQAAVLGVILLLLLRSIPAKHSRIRYAISLLSLFALLIITVCTYSITGRSQSHIAGSAVTSEIISSSPIVSEVSGIILERSGDNSSGLTSLFPGVSNYFSLIVAIWIIGVIAFTIRTAGGIYLTGRYKKRNVHILPKQILDKFQKIRQAFGIRKKILFLASGDIQVPMLIGYFKPVVLIPSSLISGIPVIQIEAIVTHELAHIIRNDYLYNLIQVIIEIIYFYHPVVWLISRQVRIEREHCCDDMCIEKYGSVNIYALALASVSEFASQHPVLSLALAGRKKILYNRIYRLINPQKMKTNRYDKLTAGMLIVALVMIVTLSTGTREKAVQPTIEPAALINLADVFPGAEPAFDPKIIPLVEAINHTEQIMLSTDQDTSIDVKDNRVTKTIQHNDGTKESIEMLIKDGQVEELYIDGERIPEDRMDEYEDVIDGTTDELLHIKFALQEAREGLEDIDFDEIYEDVRKQTQEMQFITQDEIQKIKQEMQNIHIEMPEINFDSIKENIELAMQEINIDVDKMMVDVEIAMQEVKKVCEEIDWEEMREEFRQSMEEIEMIDMEEIREEFEKARENMEGIDREMIEKQIQQAMQQLEQIDLKEIQFEMQRAMEDIQLGKADMEKEKQKMDEMIQEIEKLELNTDNH